MPRPAIARPMRFVGCRDRRWTRRSSGPPALRYWMVGPTSSGERFWGAPAEASGLAAQLGQEGQALSSCYHLGPVWLSSAADEAELRPVLYYLAIREARRKRRSLLLASSGAAGAADPATVLGPDATFDRNRQKGSAPAASRLLGWPVHRAAFMAFSAMTEEKPPGRLKTSWSRRWRPRCEIAPRSSTRPPSSSGSSIGRSRDRNTSSPSPTTISSFAGRPGCWPGWSV